MTLVESISGESQNQIEQIRRVLLIHSARDGTRDKIRARRFNHIRFLFTNGLDDGVRRAKRYAAKLMQHLHDLLLIHHDSIGLGRQSIHHLVQLGHGLAFIFARVEVRNQFHRTRPKQGVCRD